jgi:hypothetical protein
MPRWLREKSRATLIDGASEREELEEQLLRVERNLRQFYQANPVRTIHPPGTKSYRPAPFSKQITMRRNLSLSTSVISSNKLVS